MIKIESVWGAACVGIGAERPVAGQCTYIYLPTLPISTPTQNNSFVCKPKHWRTWGTKTYWGTCRLATFFPSTRAPPVVWCCAMEPRHKKKQRIPFDVSHNFVLLTILKYNVFGCRGRGDKTKRHKWWNQRKCDNKTSNSLYFLTNDRPKHLKGQQP